MAPPPQNIHIIGLCIVFISCLVCYIIYLLRTDTNGDLSTHFLVVLIALAISIIWPILLVMIPFFLFAVIIKVVTDKTLRIEIHAAIFERDSLKTRKQNMARSHTAKQYLSPFEILAIEHFTENIELAEFSHGRKLINTDSLCWCDNYVSDGKPYILVYEKNGFHQVEISMFAQTRILKLFQVIIDAKNENKMAAAREAKNRFINKKIGRGDFVPVVYSYDGFDSKIETLARNENGSWFNKDGILINWFPGIKVEVVS